MGTVKDIPGVRTYVAVDGGMSDNPRPVLYGSGYEVFLPRSVEAPRPDDYDLVLIATLHPGHDYGWLEYAPTVLDATYKTASGRSRFVV